LSTHFSRSFFELQFAGEAMLECVRTVVSLFAGDGFRQAVCWSTAAVLLCGCGSKPARVTVPEFDPPGMSAVVIDKKDANHDGAVSADELKDWPGLKAVLGKIDRNKDGKVDQSEIEQHLREYSASRIGLQSLTCIVTVNGAPLSDATVDFIPEEFLASVIKPARAVTGETGSGPVLPVDGGIPGIAPGIYRVTISRKNGDREMLPAKYNTATELGFDVSTAGGGAPAKFDLSTK
jgi:hypothetical protein